MRDAPAKPGLRPTGPAAPDASVRDAAVCVLEPRIRAIARRAAAALARDESSITGVHKLRVATRRADAAIRMLGPAISIKRANDARRSLRRLRRAAGEARSADVFLSDLSRLIRRLDGDESLAAAHLIRAATEDGQRARKRLRNRVRAGDLDDVRRAARRFLRQAERLSDDASFADLGQSALREARAAFAVCCESELRDIDRLHDLRLSAKRVRYTIEVFRSTMPEDHTKQALEALADLQDSLGGVNDSHDALGRVLAAIDRLADDADVALRVGLGALALRFESQRDARRAACVERLGELLPRLRARLQRLSGGAVASPGAPTAGARVPRVAPSSPGAPAGPPPGAPLNGAGLRARHDPLAPLPSEPASPAAWRLAAIDVGTNTVRLIIAEAEGAGNYRILDDEKETSRLGRGLAATGALAPEAIDAAATTIAHMRRIAEGYGAARIRVVATAAVREATNRAEFLSLVRQRAGLPVDVISAEQEARLAFVSASRAFDIRSLPAAVVDVGGGSTEVVLSAQGVIEEIATIPIGAVRLTEQFGGPEGVSGERYREMRAHIREKLRDRLPRSAHDLQMLIGSGGTFEAIAKIAMCEERGVSSVSAGARGYDLRREDVQRILKRLRGMTDQERRAVPGLSSQRADIIVAGAAIVLEVLKRLRVDRLRVNDGGIRDGIIRSMIGEHFAPPQGESPARARARAVRDFAAGCRYDRRHCFHVAGLALSLFDALASHGAAPPGPWRNDESRALLEAAAILHDCGYHINYARHHLHSHHLIIHSDMPGFSRRELEIVAAVARYHRGSAPKPKHEAFGVLSREDRDLVMALSAILRIADGLDRTHTQRVRALRLEHASEHPSPWLIHVDAESDPVVDIWGSERKADVFRAFFGSMPRIVWSCSAPSDRTVSRETIPENAS